MTRVRNPDVPQKPNMTRWLWWLALLFIAAGSFVGYQIQQSQINPDAHQQFMLTIMVTVIGAGICIIAATSRFWMHR